MTPRLTGSTVKLQSTLLTVLPLALLVLFLITEYPRSKPVGEAAGKGVHTADVGVEEVDRLVRIAEHPLGAVAEQRDCGDVPIHCRGQGIGEAEPGFVHGDHDIGGGGAQ